MNINANDDKSRLTTSGKEKADVLGTFFSSVFTVEPAGDIPVLPPYQVQSAMSLLIISDELINAKLQNLNVCKSVGLDGIHPIFIKELATQLCKQLGILFNKSLNECKLPNEWKQAKVSAIF